MSLDFSATHALLGTSLFADDSTVVPVVGLRLLDVTVFPISWGLKMYGLTGH